MFALQLKKIQTGKNGQAKNAEPQERAASKMPISKGPLFHSTAQVANSHQSQLVYLVQIIWPNSAFDLTQSLIFAGCSKFDKVRSSEATAFDKLCDGI